MYKFAKKVANHEGFTLVELIVVIAILGILAGIAIPVYSGYIKKANQAADVMLLGAVNTALAAACAENDFARLSDCALDIKNEKIAGIIPKVETMDDDPAAAVGTMDLAGKIAASFLVYFGNNTETPLKYAKTADKYVFNNTEQTFSIVGVGSGASAAGTYSFFGATVTLSQTDITNLQNSIFGQMGATNLTSNVAKVTGVATDLLANEKGKRYMSDEGFVEFMSGILPEGTTIDDLEPAQKANALVLYAANQSSGKTGADYVTAFTTNKVQTMLNLRKNDPQYLADAAAAYATLMAFAYSEDGKNYMVGDQTVKDYFVSQTSSLAHMSDIVTLFTTIDSATSIPGEDTALLSFTKNNAGTQLDGYLSALNMVDSNLSNISADKILTLLGSGYASQDVIDLLSQIIGD